MSARAASAALLFASGAAALTLACGSEDGFIEIENDLGRPVEVHQCSDNLCLEDFHYSDRLPAGASFSASVSTIGVPNPWLVSGLDGERLGCLPLVMPEPTEGLVARTSQAVPCQQEYDESEFWPAPDTRQE